MSSTELPTPRGDVAALSVSTKRPCARKISSLFVAPRVAHDDTTPPPRLSPARRPCRHAPDSRRASTNASWSLLCSVPRAPQRRPQDVLWMARSLVAARRSWQMTTCSWSCSRSEKTFHARSIVMFASGWRTGGPGFRMALPLRRLPYSSRAITVRWIRWCPRDLRHLGVAEQPLHRILLYVP